MFSNTPRAHQLKKTSDWVVIYYDGRSAEGQCTVTTSAYGLLACKRIVRGREPALIADGDLADDVSARAHRAQLDAVEVADTGVGLTLDAQRARAGGRRDADAARLPAAPASGCGHGMAPALRPAAAV